MFDISFLSRDIYSSVDSRDVKDARCCRITASRFLKIAPCHNLNLAQMGGLVFRATGVPQLHTRGDSVVVATAEDKDLLWFF